MTHRDLCPAGPLGPLFGECNCKSYGTSLYTGIAEDVPMPIIRTGKTNIEDVDGQT